MPQLLTFVMPDPKDTCPVLILLGLCLHLTLTTTLTFRTISDYFLAAPFQLLSSEVAPHFYLSLKYQWPSKQSKLKASIMTHMLSPKFLFQPDVPDFYIQMPTTLILLEESHGHLKF